MPHTTIARLRAIAAITSLTLVLSVLVAGAARAQFLPAVFYGTGLQPGQTIAAYINGKFCVQTTANDRGEWILQIAADAKCEPTAGATVTFAVNNVVMTADPPATWQSGGIPAGSIRTGYTLTPDESAPAGTPGADGNGDNAEAADDEDDGSGSNALVLVGVGVIVLAAAAAGGLYLYRRNAF